MSMNTSQFMDKQIMEFSAMQTTTVTGAGELLDCPNPRDDQNHGNAADGGGYGTSGGDGTSDGDGEIEEEIDPRYDFQPIRAIGSQTVPHRTTPPPQPMDSGSRTHESSSVIREKEKDACDSSMVEIDSVIKRHADNLLYSLEGISSRLAQLESRTHLLENSLDGLKMSVGDTVGKTDGKLRQLENILIEVKTGVQVLRDKKEDEESRKLFKSTASQEPAPPHQSFHRPNHASVPPQQPTPPQQSIQQPHQPPVPQQPPIHFALPVENSAPTPPQQNTFPLQISGSVPRAEIPFVPSLPLQQSFHPPGQPQESTQQQYQAPAHQPPPHQHYQMPPQYSQPPQTTQTRPLLPIKSEGTPDYVTLQHQTYPPMIRPHSMPSQPPPSGHPQQLYGPNSNMHEPPTRRSGSGSAPPAGYGPPMVAGFPEPHNYSGSPSQYNSKPSTFSSSSGGGNNPQRLPTAKLLPQSTPVGSSSNGSAGNRVPIDDVVDKVATMGFSREQVKETVKKLTENGQSVDLNVVLDKLMNGG